MSNNQTKEAFFAAGCFWGVEDAFQELPGVRDVVSGYAGGHTEHPTYEKVCSGTTGHAETVRVTYNPADISYEKLLERFWKIHNPTQVGRQGVDIGSQYRSAIFYTTPEEKEAAEKSKTALEASGKYATPIVTEIVPAGAFYEAEEYHQDYVKKTGRGACHISE